MNFVKHSNLEGQHAFLGASTYHWINYTEEKVADAYAKYRAAQRGTVLHSLPPSASSWVSGYPSRKRH